MTLMANGNMRISPDMLRIMGIISFYIEVVQNVYILHFKVPTLPLISSIATLKNFRHFFHHYFCRITECKKPQYSRLTEL